MHTFTLGGRTLYAANIREVEIERLGKHLGVGPGVSVELPRLENSYKFTGLVLGQMLDTLGPQDVAIIHNDRPSLPLWLEVQRGPHSGLLIRFALGPIWIASGRIDEVSTVQNLMCTPIRVKHSRLIVNNGATAA